MAKKQVETLTQNSLRGAPIMCAVAECPLDLTPKQFIEFYCDSNASFGALMRLDLRRLVGLGLLRLAEDGMLSVVPELQDDR